MKKGMIVVIVIVVLAAVAGGGFALLHKSNKKNTPASSAAKTTNSTPAVNNAVLVTKTSSSLGQYLAEPNGQPLYIYSKDSQGVSNCTGSCLTEWPAYQATGSTTNLPAGVSTIKRTDNGQTQYTYNGMPLYTFVDDHSGSVTGNGVDNFSIAKPTAAASSSSGSQPVNSTAAGSSSASSSSSSSNW